jgi:cytochrome P450 PksS
MVRAQPAMFQAVRYFRRLIARRRAQPTDDLVSSLVEAEEEGDRLSEDEVIGMIALILLAGYETTINLIATGTLALVEHPDQRARLGADAEITETAVEELLRYTSPADFAVFRVSREDVTLGEAAVRIDEAVLAVLGSANRDGEQFPDPDRLDLGREPNRHVAFGAGAHFCMGAPLARLEGRIALSTLFRRFPGLRLAQPKGTLRWRRSLLFRGLESLPIVLAG